MTTAKRARDVLEHYRLGPSAVFIVGAFDKGITVLSQQVRALNLVWALIEADHVNLDLDKENLADTQTPGPSRKRIAVVGAGFAGLTFAAGLLKKRVNADVTVFERRDTVMPLQHGSDTRWLHPHIYDWPSRGSEAYSAALPVLNWTAGRASDVVVQVLKEWHDVADTDQAAPAGISSDPPKIRVFCNTHHLQISEATTTSPMAIEWIGEERDPSDPALPVASQPSRIGDSKPFDIVVLAVGFGLESATRTFYWRNETLAQPHLGQARNTYIVSGSGDGAVIDLCRLRISHFRQDRILAELFSDRSDLLGRLRDENPPGSTGLDAVRRVWEDASLQASTNAVLDRLRSRLRHDTTVLLRVLNPSFANLFDGKRVSFQNRLLAYLLYRCGAFTPVTAPKEADLDRLAEEHGVTKERIIIRHGTNKQAGLTELLAGDLRAEVDRSFADPAQSKQYLQTEVPKWPGGYFDMPGIREYRDPKYHVSDAMKSHWRQEYLPSPTEAVATAFCAAVAGLIADATPSTSRLRVTLHRKLISSDEIVLQQCCDYQGLNLNRGRAGRTFPSRNGTIGAAFTLRRVIHTQRDAKPSALQEDMAAMSLSEAAQTMSRDVASVAAIPLLAEGGNEFTQDVIAVLYLDSYEPNAFVERKVMGELVRMCEKFLDSLPTLTQTTAGRISNFEFWQRSKLREVDAPAINPDSWKALQKGTIGAPQTDKLRHLNFDFSDFTPVEQS